MHKKEQPENLPEVQLGKQLENPYSVENMKSLQNLMEKKENEGTDNARIIEDSLDIEVTDYYVKFLVENDDQMNLLLSDSLNLSFFPLDVELDDNLDYYANENTETQEAYWLYTAVQKDYQFHPEITYEKIEDLFLIEETDHEQRYGNSISLDLLEELEDEALRITNNLDPVEEENLRLGARKVKPKGHIKVKNTETGNFDPVVGVKVKKQDDGLNGGKHGLTIKAIIK